MNGIQRIEAALAGKKALVPYIMAGDPHLDATAAVLHALDEAGADLIEVGLPFSDPLADGPVIQAAGLRALAAGTTTKKVLDLLAREKASLRAPRVLMGYANPLLRYGVERFADDATAAAVSGVIIPDLPLSEGSLFADTLRARGIALICMAAPNATEERLREIGNVCEGFLYCVSLLGTTGSDKLAEKSTANDTPTNRLKTHMERLRRHTSKPLLLGFGIDSPEKAKRFAPLADGLVVGSSLVKLLAATEKDDEKPEKAGAFLHLLRKATTNVTN